MRLSTFIDAPEPDQSKALMESWQKPEPPAGLKSMLQKTRRSVIELCLAIGKRLADTRNRRYKSRQEVVIIEWLYSLIRLNVKRGREFDLRLVLETRKADCLGYSKLFTVLGRLCRLEAGIVEVIMDNAGRLVPHTAVLVKLADGRVRFIDLWYGSQNIRHKLLGLNVRRGKAWHLEDVDFKELKELEAVTYLPDSVVNGITTYIIGNRYLKNHEYGEAVKRYSEALELYPANPRFLYNRAIAFEKLGERKKSEADYVQALLDENAKRRVLAREYEEVTALIQLDAAGIDSKTQEIYLLHVGFITGRKVSSKTIARKFGLSEGETKGTLKILRAPLEKIQN